MKQSTKIRIIIMILLLILALAFYWYEWRPEKIKNDCARSIVRMSSAGSSMSNENARLFQTLCEDAGGINNLIDARDN